MAVGSNPRVSSFYMEFASFVLFSCMGSLASFLLKLHQLGEMVSLNSPCVCMCQEPISPNNIHLCAPTPSQLLAYPLFKNLPQCSVIVPAMLRTPQASSTRSVNVLPVINRAGSISSSPDDYLCCYSIHLQFLNHACVVILFNKNYKQEASSLTGCLFVLGDEVVICPGCTLPLSQSSSQAPKSPLALQGEADTNNGWAK